MKILMKDTIFKPIFCIDNKSGNRLYTIDLPIGYLDSINDFFNGKSGYIPRHITYAIGNFISSYSQFEIEIFKTYFEGNLFFIECNPIDIRENIYVNITEENAFYLKLLGIIK